MYVKSCIPHFSLSISLWEFFHIIKHFSKMILNIIQWSLKICMVINFELIYFKLFSWWMLNVFLQAYFFLIAIYILVNPSYLFLIISIDGRMIKQNCRSKGGNHFWGIWDTLEVCTPEVIHKWAHSWTRYVWFLMLISTWQLEYCEFLKSFPFWPLKQW